MVTTTIQSGFGAFKDFFKDTPASGELTDLFALTHLQRLGELVDSFDQNAVTFTAVGSTGISAYQGTPGTSSYFAISINGTGFGPITGADLDEMFDNFASAVMALDGSASANLQSIVISDQSGEILRLDVTASSWTLTSGADTLTINGAMPTSLSQVQAAVDELFPVDPATGERAPASNFDPATSSLAGFDITSITAASDGAAQGTMTFSDSAIDVTLGHFNLHVTGDLPDNFAEVADMMLGASGYTFTGATLTDTDTNAVIAQMTTSAPVDIHSLIDSGIKGIGGTDGDDAFVVNTTEGNGFDVNLGAGNDTFTTRDHGGDDEFGMVIGEAGANTVYMGEGDHDRLEIYFNDNGYHPYVPLQYAVDGDDLVITVRPGQTVRLTDQMIKSNVEEITGAYNVDFTAHGTAGDDHVSLFADMPFYHAGAGDDIIDAPIDGFAAIYGEAGNDLIGSEAGNNYLDGGAGSDTVSYVFSTAGVTIDLAAGQASGATAGTDTLISIENAIAAMQLVHSGVAIQGIRPAAAVDHVALPAAGQHVGHGTAGDGVGPGAANGVLDADERVGIPETSVAVPAERSMVTPPMIGVSNAKISLKRAESASRS